MESKIGQFEGVQWFAALVNEYDTALNVLGSDLQAALVKDFQARLLGAILDPNMEVDGLLRILAPAEFEILQREREVELAEREAKFKVGG